MSARGRAAESRSFCLAKSGSSTDPTHRQIQTRVLLLQSASGLKNTELHHESNDCGWLPCQN